MNNYQAFLLRLRHNPDRPYWYATLENVHTGESLHFTTPAALLAYLAGVTAPVLQEIDTPGALSSALKIE